VRGQLGHRANPFHMEERMETCPSCGRPARFEITEVFPRLREVHVEGCCEANSAGWIDALRDYSRKERRTWMLRETGIRVHDLLAGDGTIHWTLDYGLHIEEIELEDAKQFIAEHHRHCEPPVGWMFGAAVFNGSELVAVMTAGQPVSRVLARRGYLEVNRVCAKDVAPHALVFNACSMLYGHACRKAFERGHPKVVSYTLASESGAALRAAGFRPVARTRGGPWHRRSRPRSRSGKSSTAPKIRWERWNDKAVLPIQLSLPMAS